MTKPEAERIIKAAVPRWRREVCPDTPADQLHFFDFERWLLERWPDAMSFRARGGASYIARIWFDQAIGMSWAN